MGARRHRLAGIEANFGTDSPQELPTLATETSCYSDWGLAVVVVVAVVVVAVEDRHTWHDTVSTT